MSDPEQQDAEITLEPIHTGAVTETEKEEDHRGIL